MLFCRLLYDCHTTWMTWYKNQPLNQHLFKQKIKNKKIKNKRRRRKRRQIFIATSF
jgi:hypothetical protein